jgi:hypothetical protein
MQSLKGVRNCGKGGDIFNEAICNNKIKMSTLHMTSEGLLEMFEGNFAGMCGNKILLVLIGEWATLSRVR